jgi:putative hydrolase of the HAD superfamily
VVDATYSGILKPEPRAYEAALAAAGVAASDAVFVDDQARNVAGAVKLGIPTVQFEVMQPAASYRQALRLLGVAPPKALQEGTP